MEAFEQNFWEMRLAACKEALEKNRFEVHIAEDTKAARTIFHQDILPTIDVQSASWGDSMTLRGSSILDDIKHDPSIELIAQQQKCRSCAERRVHKLAFQWTPSITVNVDLSTAGVIDTARQIQHGKFWRLRAASTRASKKR